MTQQVHLGESNHVNNLTNCSFYIAMQTYHKDDIVQIEKSYDMARKKREKRLKERVKALEQQVEATKD